MPLALACSPVKVAQLAMPAPGRRCRRSITPLDTVHRRGVGDRRRGSRQPRPSCVDGHDTARCAPGCNVPGPTPAGSARGTAPICLAHTRSSRVPSCPALPAGACATQHGCIRTDGRLESSARSCSVGSVRARHGVQLRNVTPGNGQYMPRQRVRDLHHGLTWRSSRTPRATSVARRNATSRLASVEQAARNHGCCAPG